MATIYKFSLLTNGQHLPFDPETDQVVFDASSYSASSLRLSLSSGNLSLAYGAKNIWLDGVAFGQLSTENTAFANGSYLLLGDGTTDLVADWYGQHYELAATTVGHQIWGLGGADYVQTGSGHDYIVGNDALTALNHISRSGSVGSPNGSFNPTISADGRFVGFQGGWTSFGSQSNSSTDVLVKDLSSGSVTNEHKTATGEFGLSGSGRPVISGDGNWLAFWSGSALLPNAWGSIYLANTQSTEIKVVSSTSTGVLSNGPNDWPDLSADGRYVAFQSRATNLAPGGNVTYSDIYVKDMQTGALQRAAGVEANYDCLDAKISGDGRFVVFSSSATNLTAVESGTYAGQSTDIYVWDRSDGSLTNITGGKGGRFDALNPDVGFDRDYGGVVVFQTGKALVAGDTNNAIDVYAFSLVDETFTRVSTRADGSQHAVSSYAPSVSGDGRWVVFRSGDASTPLVAGDSNGYDDIFVKDLHTGAIALVSRPPGAQANQVSGNPEISAGGDWIVFESSASNLATTDANGTTTDVFRVSNPLLRDTLEGGLGNDTYVIARNDVIIEKANGGVDLVESRISHTLGSNIENLTLTGTGAINGTGNTLNNRLTGNSAKNVLSAENGNDLLNGGAGNDSLVGGAGADTLIGGTGADTMNGGTGNDIYYTDSSQDIVVESADSVNGGIDTIVSGVSWTLGSLLEYLTLSGSVAINGTGNSLNNKLTGNTANNILSGGNGNDSLNGGAGNDSLVGGAGADTLVGGTGADTMNGGIGNDTYYADSNQDVVVESTDSVNGGIDTIVSGVSWTLGSLLEHLTLSGTVAINGTGNSLANRITGNSANNVLSGGNGHDTLIAGSGDDLLRGGTGNDILYGGAGKDLFRFDTALSTSTTPNIDQIKDFSVLDDTIQLENAIFTKFGTTTTGTINAAYFKANTTGLAADSNDYIIYETDTGKLFYDANGNAAGGSVQIALLGINLALTSADFVLI